MKLSQDYRDKKINYADEDTSSQNRRRPDHRASASSSSEYVKSIGASCCRPRQFFFFCICICVCVCFVISHFPLSSDFQCSWPKDNGRSCTANRPRCLCLHARISHFFRQVAWRQGKNYHPICSCSTCLLQKPI